MDLPLLSLIVFLPAAGALVILVLSDHAWVKWTALTVTLADFALTILMVVGFDTTTHAMQFRETHAWIPALGITYALGVDGISALFVFLTALLGWICVLASWVAIDRKVKEFMVSLLDHADADARGVRGARPVPVLRLLGGDADPDVPDHRRLGRRRPGLRRVQVLPLHPGRERRVPGRRHRALFPGRRDLRHPRPHGARLSVRDRVLAVLRLPGRLRRQGADGPGPHLASRRPRAGADGRQHHPRGRSAEDGRLRVPAVLAADAAGGVGALLDADAGALGRRDRLWRPAGPGAGRSEEAGRLFQHQPHGLRDPGDLRAQRPGDGGRDPADVQPRHHHRRAVPVRRPDLRADPHPQHRRLWRADEGGPGLHRLPGALHPVVDGAARHQRLRRRASRADRHVRRQPGARRRRRPRCAARRGLSPGDVPPRRPRPSPRRPTVRHLGRRPPRAGGDPAAGRVRALGRPLSQAVPRHHPRLGRAPAGTGPRAGGRGP